MSQHFTLASVNVSRNKGSAKLPVPSVEVDLRGMVGDAHAGPWDRQISMIGLENLAAMAADVGETLGPGELAENLTTQGLDLERIALLDRIRVGHVELLVTQIGKSCHGDGCSVYRRVGRCVMPKHGIFCRVVSPGTMSRGDTAVLEERPFRVRIVTLSDRAARGEYADLSGPSVQELVEEGLAARRWHLVCERVVLPDDAGELELALRSACEEGVDVVFTTGGTGVGPRDVSPDVVTAVCDRLVPGIMEAIRIKHGATNPRALLSRSIAGVAGRTLIYALPGSVRAVKEYVPEILLTLEHLLLTLHGLEAH